MNSKELSKFVNFSDFRKNSISYFTNKVKFKLNYIKFLIYICLVFYFIDLIMILIFPFVFNHILNILAISLKILSTIFIFFSLKNKFQNISLLEYNLIKQIIIIDSFVSILFYIDLLYILIHNIIHLNENFLKIFERSIPEITVFTFSIILYILVNIIFPLSFLVKMIELKNNLLEIDYENEKKNYKEIRRNEDTSRSDFFPKK